MCIEFLKFLIKYNVLKMNELESKQLTFETQLNTI